MNHQNKLGNTAMIESAKRGIESKSVKALLEAGKGTGCQGRSFYVRFFFPHMLSTVCHVLSELYYRVRTKHNS